MERIGIFGGTFNPVHNEHIALARKALEELNLDKLFIVPTANPPHKNAYPIKAKDRLNMLKLAFKDDEKIEISDYEIKNGGKSYSYITAEHFKKKYDCQVYMIVGGDMLENFKFWKFPERILSSVDLAVFTREDFNLSIEKEREYFRKTFNKDFTLLTYGGKECSSTKIRTYANFDLDIGEFTTKEVSEYVVNNGLYRDDIYQVIVGGFLKPSRVRHTANVVLCALKKAKELGLDEEKVKLATTLHDVAKYVDYKQVEGFKLPEEMPEPVIHAFLGAFIAEVRFNITDQDVINAIRYHTSGRANMSTLEKLVFVSDMIEEDRDYKGVDKLREYYEEDFEKCFIECVKEEMIHLKNKKTAIYHLTEDCYEYYVTKGE